MVLNLFKKVTRYFRIVRGEQLDTFFLKKKFKRLRKKGENLRFPNNLESKKSKFYIPDIRYEKRFGGYFLKKNTFLDL